MTDADIIKAIEDGFEKVATAEREREIEPPSDGDSPEFRRVEPKRDDETQADYDKRVKAAANSLTGIAGGLAGVMAKSTKAGLNYIVKQNEFLETQLSFVRTSQKAYGGLTDEYLRSGEAIEGLVGHSIEAKKELMLSAAGGKEAALQIADGAFQGQNVMAIVFDDIAKGAELYEETLSVAASQNSNLANSMKNLGKEEMVRVSTLRERMDIDTLEMQNMLKRQYAFTGEASSKIFEDIGAVSVELSKVTGVSAMDLKDGIAEIMEDVDTFGNIGVDSAARIAASLKQLGVDFRTFQGITSQFMNFETAAGKMGELSALFGVQMDAMEMTYLANEDQEEFLFQLRENLLDSGVDVENMSKTRQRYLADQIGIDVTQLQTFMRGDEVTDQEDMFSATKTAKTLDGFSTSIENFGGTMKGLNKDMAQVAKAANAQMFIPLQTDMMNLKRAGEQANAAMQPKISQENIDLLKTSIDKEIHMFDTMVIPPLEVGMEFVTGKSGDIGGMLNKLLGGGAAGELFIDAAVTTVDLTAPDVFHEDLASASKQIRLLSEQGAVTDNRIKELVDSNIQQQDTIDKIMTAMEAKQPIQIRIDIDEDGLADNIFTIRETQQGGKFVIVPDQ